MSERSARPPSQQVETRSAHASRPTYEYTDHDEREGDRSTGASQVGAQGHRQIVAVAKPVSGRSSRSKHGRREREDHSQQYGASHALPRLNQQCARCELDVLTLVLMVPVVLLLVPVLVLLPVLVLAFADDSHRGNREHAVARVR